MAANNGNRDTVLFCPIRWICRRKNRENKRVDAPTAGALLAGECVAAFATTFDLIYKCTVRPYPV
jgi:hypothetical protein